MKNYGVQELNAKEIQETDGGVSWLTWVALSIAADIAMNPCSAWDELVEGWNSY